ncbi:MAG: molybdate ABC transporter substrate-binding protein, partial [Chloroflexota bacterium]|nr:molybdate ABC transporter substrate-binding protein [Chloroflexota bacterium]
MEWKQESMGMSVATPRRSFIHLVLFTMLCVLGMSLGVPGGPRLVGAQSAIECPAPASPDASTPAAMPTAEAVASPAAFPASGELTVFAAASLTDAFSQIADDIQAEHPEVSIAFNFAGSQALATQITEGAPADVFASANAAQVQVVADAGLIVGEPRIFVQNRLAVAVPAGNPAGIATPADLAGDDLRLVLATADVPVGRYSREAICAMGADPNTYGAGFVDAVAANIVSAEEDVRAVMTKVQLGEADAGIVYVSDVTADVAGAVEIIEIPDAVNIIASYPIASISDG